MSEKDTEELQHELIAAEKVDDYLANNHENLQNYTLAEYLELLLKQKGLDKKAVIGRSGLDSTYAYHIFAGRKAKTSRNKAIALALAMELTPKETQHLLYYDGATQLYVRDSWDSIIWHALEHHLTVPQTNDLLASLSETVFLE
ncbi:helix-turn-helix transcriptional regulator [Selenomonas sp. AB3002]|uniref:helix-turn-helix domain-containing protein n=1 Tax=Selenomonas sp. AB3002 TaxID=1392502 RepID=UPI000496FE31